MPERKTLNEDIFYKGSSANLPRLHTSENKTPFWDKSKPFASQIDLFDQIDGISAGTIISSQSRPGNNVNKEIFHFPHPEFRN